MSENFSRPFADMFKKAPPQGAFFVIAALTCGICRIACGGTYRRANKLIVD